MSFADELRHAVSVIPVLDGHGQTHPLPTQPPARVLGLEEGFDHLLATARAKDLFRRFVWKEMAIAGVGDEQQLRNWMTRLMPVPEEGAMWCPGSYVRVLYRTDPRRVTSWLSVGSGLSPEEARLPLYRALWDVGIRELHHYLHRDTPYTAALLARGQYAYDDRGRYLHGVMTLGARP